VPTMPQAIHHREALAPSLPPIPMDAFFMQPGKWIPLSGGLELVAAWIAT